MKATRILLLVIIVAGFSLRAAGFTRGDTDFVLPEDRAKGYESSFHSFHPDELTLIESALRPIDLLNPPFTV